MNRENETKHPAPQKRTEKDSFSWKCSHQCAQKKNNGHFWKCCNSYNISIMYLTKLILLPRRWKAKIFSNIYCLFSYFWIECLGANIHPNFHKNAEMSTDQNAGFRSVFVSRWINMNGLKNREKKNAEKKGTKATSLHFHTKRKKF